MTPRTAPPRSQRRSDRRRTLQLGVLAQVVVLLAVSCGVPTGDSSFQSISGDEIPNRLNDPTTTTTTSTTTTTTTTLPDIPESTIEQTKTTSTTEVPQVLVTIYFVSRGVLQPVLRPVPPLFGFNQLVALLEEGPGSGPLGVGLDSFVAENLIDGQPTTEGGVIKIDLDSGVFDEINPRSQRQAIAQIVLTFLENTTAVGQVSFTIDGEPFLAPTDSGSQELASVDDFRSLLPGGSPSTTLPPGIEPTSGTTTTTLG